MNKRRLIGKRKEIGYTQADMARKIGISEAAYRLKEQGKREFTETELVKITEITKTSIVYFFEK